MSEARSTGSSLSDVLLDLLSALTTALIYELQYVNLYKGQHPPARSIQYTGIELINQLILLLLIS